MRENGHTKRDNIPHKGQSLSDVQGIRGHKNSSPRELFLCGSAYADYC